MLEGKKVLVTGAARGIGRAIAEKMAQAGADVAVADLREDLVAEVAGTVEAAGRKSLSLNVDVTIPSDGERMMNETIAELGDRCTLQQCRHHQDPRLLRGDGRRLAADDGRERKRRLLVCSGCASPHASPG